MANFCGLVFEVSVADFRRCFPFLRGFGQFSKKTCLVGSREENQLAGPAVSI